MKIFFDEYKFTLGVKYNELISLVKLAWRRSSQSILENIFLALKHHSIEKSVFQDAYVNFLGVLSENIVQCQKTFFLCLLYIYTFPIESFNFFCELTDLGSKLGLQRAQFRSCLTELDLYANSKSLIYCTMRAGTNIWCWELLGSTLTKAAAIFCR